MIYLFLSPGFEEMEAVIPVDILRRAGLDVCTVGIGGRTVEGAHGISVVADTADFEAMPDDIEAIVLPGGAKGTENLEKSQVVQRFLDVAVEKQVLIAAICAAPSILGHRGLLKGYRATCFPGYEQELTGAQIVDDFIVKDGLFLTAKGAGNGLEFGLALVSALCGGEKSVQIRKALQCP